MNSDITGVGWELLKFIWFTGAVLSPLFYWGYSIWCRAKGRNVKMGIVEPLLWCIFWPILITLGIIIIGGCLLWEGFDRVDEILVAKLKEKLNK